MLPNPGSRTRRVLWIGLVLVAVAAIPILWFFVLKPSAAAPPTYDNHGTNSGIIGPNGTQITTVNAAPKWPVVSPKDHEELARQLRLMPSKTFRVGWSMAGSAPVADGMFSDLVKGGWSPEAGESGANRTMEGMAVEPGITIFVRAPSPPVDALLKWCNAFGLRARAIINPALSPATLDAVLLVDAPP